MGIIAPNLETIRNLLLRNERDFLLAISRRGRPASRRAAWAALCRRRTRAVRLIEELCLRTRFLIPIAARLREVGQRMQACRTKMQQHRGGLRLIDVEARGELHRLMYTTRESPATLDRRLGRMITCYRRYTEAKRVLAAGNLRLVISIAKRYRDRGLSLEDLDYAVGDGEARFSDFLTDPAADDSADQLDRRLLSEMIARVLRGLTARERKILRLRFGLGDGQARSLAEIGELMSVSRERVRQIEKEALTKLRQPNRLAQLASFVNSQQCHQAWCSPSETPQSEGLQANEMAR